MPESPDPKPKPLDHLPRCGADESPALVLRDHTLSYKDLKDRVARLSGWLRHRLPQTGARVATWAAKTELACLMPLAAARAGLVHVPINPLLKHGQVAHILADSGAKMLLGTKARLATLEEGDVPADAVCIDELDVLAELDAVTNLLGPSAHNPDDLCAILYTSGSTGRPKGVMLSHANLWLGAVSVAHYLGVQHDDVTLGVLPLSFDYGQNQLLSTWYAGGSVVPLDYLFARDVVRACAKYGVTTLAAVPPLWVQLTELDWPGESVTPIRRLTNSGGALTSDMVADLGRIFPQARLFPMYGLTEAFRSTYLKPELADAHPTSMGSAIPFAEILVIDDDGGVAAPDTEGELVHCGPLVAQGYWQDEARTAERFKAAPPSSEYGGVAVWSGDRVKRDASGLLYFVGRRDSMIKSAGNRISPNDIEEAARATGLVAEAVALGIPDARLGHAIHLVARAAADSADAATQVPRALAKELPNFMQPHAIHWRDSLPVNPNGKLDRGAILAEITALVEQRAAQDDTP
ncbi:acyl-CoA ligase (AMP-forming), exosortase A system-associated [Pontixanthobacter sp.]|uniref:acyl-CoA ligase (AMP-forming), exosortase A system-associated n=1 Tax=Pontixanthobacter sp. TaxID=2792078 RepID=UPI003C7DAAD5